VPRGGHGEEHYGTDAFCCSTPRQGNRVAQRLIATCAAQAGAKQFALEGSVFTGGRGEWLRDGLRLIKKSVDVEKLALSVPDSGGVYLVPAFTGSARRTGPVRARTSSDSRADQRRPYCARCFGIHRLPVGGLLQAMEQDSGQNR